MDSQDPQVILPQNISPVEQSTKRKPLFILLGVIVLLVLCIFGGIYYSAKKSNNSHTFYISPTPILTATPTVTATSTVKTQHIYKNNKYNFQFDYPQDVYVNGELATSYSIEEINDKIIIHKIIYYKSNNTKLDNGTVFTIYSATAVDKDNLIGWWKRNIRKDTVDFLHVPDGYDTFQPSPTVLRVHAKMNMITPGAEGTFENSYYYYYDFGTPFIIHYVIQESGGAALTNSPEQMMQTTIKKLD